MACCYRCSVICVSVCLFVGYNCEPCKNGPTNRAAICVVDSGGPKEPPGEGAFFTFLGGGHALPYVKYRERMCSAAEIRLTQSRCCFGCVLGCLETEEDGCECRLRLNRFLFMSMCSWMWLYHVFSWPLSLVICFIGLVPLYWPRLNR